MQASKEMKPSKAIQPSDASLELIAASKEVGIRVMVELSRKVLDGYGMPAEWAQGIMVSILKGNDDIIRNCSFSRAVGIECR